MPTGRCLWVGRRVQYDSDTPTSPSAWGALWGDSRAVQAELQAPIHLAKVQSAAGGAWPAAQRSAEALCVSAQEGKQASLAADFSITQFRHVGRLLMVHGRNSYKRSAALGQFVMHRGLIISTMQVLRPFVARVPAEHDST